VNAGDCRTDPVRVVRLSARTDAPNFAPHRADGGDPASLSVTNPSPLPYAFRGPGRTGQTAPTPRGNGGVA